MHRLIYLILTLLATFYASAQSFKAVDFDLTDLNEDLFLGKNKESKLLILSDEIHQFDNNKEPLILVHGINGNPSDMQAIVDRMKNSKFQIYILAYADFKRRTSLNGESFATELKKLEHKKMTIVAHSMGGIVARKALSELVKINFVSEQHTIKFFTIDTPWHGFDGPADGLKLNFVRPFLPDGLEDMRARSDFFIELNKVSFPSSITVDISFAEEGNQALDYTEVLKDCYQLKNFESALALTGKLELARKTSFEKVFPRFPGNHATVITENGFSSNYLDYLERQLEDNI